MNPTAVYDIETQDWTKFVLGVIHWPSEGRTETFRFGKEKEMAERLLSIEGEVTAHNGGRFDHLWVLDCLQRYDLVRPTDIVSNGQGIVQMRIGQTVFTDSMKVFMMSLAKLTKGGKGNIKDLCQCGKDCGGFCAVKRRAPESVLRKVEEYCVSDCTELANALEHFRGVAEDAGLTIGRTIGATAWKSASESLGLDRPDYDRKDWGLIRAGYHGGRVEPFRTESKHGYAYDVNSMYPWALGATKLPVGFVGTVYGKDAARCLSKSVPGIYNATVTVPEMFIPPLPLPLESGISFPWGTFTGTWPLNELEYAISLGVKVNAVHYACTFAREEFIFGPWVENVFSHRMSYGKDTREGKWLKNVSNSLTGKLGSRCERRAVKVWPDFDELRVCECLGECECGAFRPLDSEGKIWESVSNSGKVEACAHAEFAAYLTGAARVKLHRALIAGGDDAVYCDTDSCWAENPRTQDIGSELGQWEDKGEYRDFETLGPKTYHAFLDGEEITAAKGIPNPEWDKMKRGEPVEYQSMRGIRRAKKGENFFQMIGSQRVVTANTGRRLPGPNSTTLPPKAQSTCD
jgi:DNA polymerase type B, organellar and viral